MDNLINKEEYFEYINNNDSLTESQKSRLIYYFKKIGTEYVDKKSGKQFSFLVNSVFSSGDLDNMTKLKILLARSVGPQNLQYTIKLIRDGKLKTDEQIMAFVQSKQKYNKPYVKYTNKNDSTNDSTNNSTNNSNITNSTDSDSEQEENSRSDWEYMIESISLNIKKILSQFLLSGAMSNITYLDIGCGNGKKTKNFARFLNVKRDNINGCDIESWGPYKAKKNFDFKFTLIENGKLNYPDNTFDVVTAILTFHHITELNAHITEIKRILKKNGLLILIEHNIYNDTEAMLVDVQHLIFAIIYDHDKNYLTSPTPLKCHNYMEWEYVLSKFGFKNKMNEMLFPQLENRLRYDDLYYGIFSNEK